MHPIMHFVANKRSLLTYYRKMIQLQMIRLLAFSASSSVLKAFL